MIFACNQDDVSTYQALAERFQQTSPEAKIRVIAADTLVANSSGSNLGQLERVRQIAAGADAFVAHGSAVEAGPTGSLRDLTPLVAQAGDTAGDLSADLTAYFRWQDRIWGIPAGIYPFVLVLRPTELTAVGASEPPTAWTWDDLRVLATQVTLRDDALISRYGLADYQLNGLRSVLTARKIVTPTGLGQAGPLALDDAQVMAAVQWYRDLALVDRAMPIPGRDQVDSWDAFRRGEAAMAIIGLTDWARLTPAERTGLKVFALPGATPVEPSGYFISANTLYPDLAWRFIQFVSRQVVPTNLLPAGATRLPGGTADLDQDVRDLWQQALAYPALPLRPAVVEGRLREAVRRVLAGADLQIELGRVQSELAAAGQPQPARPRPSAEKAPVTESGVAIRFLVAEEAPYRELVRVFKDSHPEIQVELLNEMDFMSVAPVSGGMSVQSLDLRGLIDASSADCFEDSLGHSKEDLAAVALDLQPLIDADGTFSLADFYGRTLERVTDAGRLWGLPNGMKVPVLQYNRDLFDAAAASYPTDAWTWESVLTHARVLSSGVGADRHYGFLLWPGLQLVGQVQDLAGVALVDMEVTPPAVHYNTAEIVSAAELLAELVGEGVVPVVQEADAAHMALMELIQAGRVAMWPAESQDFRNTRFKLGVAQLPGSQVCCRLGSPCAVWTLHISAQTPYVQACWKWLRFLNEQPATNAFTLPPRRSNLTSTPFGQLVGTDAQRVYVQAAECKTENPYSDLDALAPGASVTLEWLAAALDEVIWRGADARTALNQAREKTVAYVACLRSCTNNSADTNCAHTCMIQTDPKAAGQFAPP